MRLIDADKIDFEKVFIGASDFAKDTREAAQKLIEEQPTAYDVDKVVERLEEKSFVPGDRIGVSDVKIIMSKKAVEIVKSGGIE